MMLGKTDLYFRPGEIYKYYKLNNGILEMIEEKIRMKLR